MTLFKNKSIFSGYKHKALRLLCLSLGLLFILPALLTGCSDKPKESVALADYGDYGTNIAVTLAESYPYRKAYSQQEKEAGLYIKGEFEKLGYKVETQTVNSATGQEGSSTNYIVHIKGEGLVYQKSNGTYTTKKKSVIVGAHYDSFWGEGDAAQVPDYNGIQENASGIGCLLTVAKELKGTKPGYDVTLVAFGAGNDSFAGAKTFVDALKPDEISKIDAMYCVESIYAGDTLYASAGWNSLIPGQKYEMRRKLYEAYDVVYENRLSSKNKVDLLYNESGEAYDVNGDGIEDVYREVTLTQSDYVPFDAAGIPIVFIESYNYNYPKIADMKETKNLRLQEANSGLIRHTNNDSTHILKDVFDSEQLPKRINNTAFIIIGAIEKGAYNALSKEDYAAGQTLAPTISVTATITPEVKA